MGSIVVVRPLRRLIPYASVRTDIRVALPHHKSENQRVLDFLTRYLVAIPLNAHS